MPRLKLTGPLMMMDTMTPKRPSAEPKISITKILTNSVLFCASLSAHELPMMPTHRLQAKRRQRAEAAMRARYEQQRTRTPGLRAPRCSPRRTRRIR
jgi:hypothetical protein